MEKEIIKQREDNGACSSYPESRKNSNKVKFCQSCGMPLTDDVFGTNADGNKNADCMMLRGTMKVLTDAKSKEMIWREGDEQYYPGGVTDPNYCVLKFTTTDGRFYSDFYPRSFVI